MSTELDLFQKTLEPKHFTAALQLRNELIDENHPQEELTVNTKDLYEKGFQFPAVTEYDNVVAQLTEVLNAQDNLNQNQDNPVLLDTFINTAQKVNKNFKKAYGDQWVDPANTVK